MIRKTTLLMLVALLALPAAALAKPGRLLSAVPYTAQILPGVPLPGTAYKIRYVSTTALGKRTVVTGSVLVPDGATKRTPLVGYAIGSQGLADRCAPSTQLANGTEYEAAIVAQALQKGWTLALTDYPGLGTKGEHPYVVGKANAPAVLDAMRAAKHLKAAKVGKKAPLGVFGYSEGGGTTGAVAEQQQTYAPDLPLKGAVVGGVIANFQRTAQYVDGGPVAFLVAYSAIGFNAAYPELKLNAALNDRGKALVKELRDTCIEQAALKANFTHASDYLSQDILHRADWVARFNENNLGAVKPSMPVLLSHSYGDEVLPYDAAVKLSQDWCKLGANVEFRTEPTPEHILSGFAHAGPAMSWLADRFAGKPTNGCN